MNIYVSNEMKNILLEKLKENQIIDEYILDRERLGKTKINIRSKENSFNTIKELIDILPNNSMVVDQIEYPGNDHILCVGEIEYNKINYFEEKDFILSIVTKKENYLRFNAWIKYENIEEIFHEKNIKNFSSINGKIIEKTFFIFETEKDKTDYVYNTLSTYTNEIIIKEEKIYVKLLLQNFTEAYKKLKKEIFRVEIIDEESF